MRDSTRAEPGGILRRAYYPEDLHARSLMRRQHIVGWFDKYLMGVPHPEYDVRPEKQVPAPEQN
jgi:hypothetical protein